MGVWRVGPAMLALASLAACGGPFVAPTTREECVRAIPDADRRSSSDTSASWSMAYSEDDRPLGTSGSIYLCVPDDIHATITTEPLPGVTVEPEPLLVRPGGGVPFLEVTVSEGEDEQDFFVHYDTDHEDGSQWVEIHVDDDEWSFRSWRR